MIRRCDGINGIIRGREKERAMPTPKKGLVRTLLGGDHM